MNKIKKVLGITFILFLSACTSAPSSTTAIECNGEQQKVIYMSEMQQYEVERFAMRHEFRPGCVSSELKKIREQTCLSAASLSYEQWMNLYNSCIINNP